MSHDESDFFGLTTQSTMPSHEAMKEIERIRLRKEEVAAALARIAQQRDELDRSKLLLEQEQSDLAITERTLARLNAIDLPAETPTAPGERPDTTTRRKPKGIPTIYIMTVTILRESNRVWLEGSEILSAIRSRWWPSAEPVDVSPTLWRLAKEGKLLKQNTSYGLPQADPVSADPAAQEARRQAIKVAGQDSAGVVPAHTSAPTMEFGPTRANG